MLFGPSAAAKLRTAWQEAWPDALRAWSPYVKLRDPAFCETKAAAKAEHLTGSFAMIRLNDHQIVIDLETVLHLKLELYAREVLAHEIGHHVYCPADLADNARMLASIRKALPLREHHAPLVSNLFSDLLINDRLQRDAGLDMAGVYKAIKNPQGSRLWDLYMRTYELLWALPSRTLTAETVEAEIEGDARLASRVVRVYAHDWLVGASRFAMLLYPYLEKEEDASQGAAAFFPFGDLEQSGAGSEVPGGLAEDDGDEPVHPVLDPKVTGEKPAEATAAEQEATDADADGNANRASGVNPKKNVPRAPRDIVEYGQILRGLGSKLSAQDVTIAYYRDLASRHVIPFPQIARGEGGEPQPEGLEIWDFGAPLENVDWLQSVLTSPVIIPGLTTVERTYGVVPGKNEDKAPLDVYIGIDCSGSMGDPARQVSYPVLAGTVVARSAFRAGARVMACLSGESHGKTVHTDGFLREEKTVMQLITGYLGTGYAFGIHHLQKHIVERPARELRPTHLLIVSDSDMFTILGEKDEGGRLGWDVARDAAAAAKGGATFVLELGYAMTEAAPSLRRMREIGWNVHTVKSMQEVVTFARQLSRELYDVARKAEISR